MATMPATPSNPSKPASCWRAIGGGAFEEQIFETSPGPSTPGLAPPVGIPTGRYRARITLNHKRTWRVLEATTRAKAIREANTRDWQAKSATFAHLAEKWQLAGCPGRKGTLKDLRQTRASLPHLIKYFGPYPADTIRLKHLPDYAARRLRGITRGTGGRTIDLDLATLSNILHWGVKQGDLEINYIYRARDRYQGRTGKIRHAYDVMPPNAEAIHRLASEFFTHKKSEVMAWLCFFSEFSGCRHSELLRLTISEPIPPLAGPFDQKPKAFSLAPAGEPGYIQWFTPREIAERKDGLLGQLYLRERSKHGVNPWVDIGPEFAEMIRAFLHWHRTRHPGAPNPRRGARPYFPNQLSQPLSPDAFNQALTRAARELGLPKITPHGFRAYFATKHLRDGRRPVEIAYDMGDRTVALIERIYTENVKGAKLWWTPADGLSAWSPWLPPSVPTEPSETARSTEFSTVGQAHPSAAKPPNPHKH